MKTSIRFITALALILPASLKAAATVRVSTTQLKPESKIEIIFDRAMVAENQLNQPLANNILKIKPNLSGKIAWRSTNIARFIPDAPPEMGETYTFSLAKGVKNREGEKLPTKTLATIAAEPFRVMGSNRRSGPNFATRQPIHYIYFNDEINPKAAAKYFVFKNRL